MSDIREVTGTAFVVAEFRSRENEEPHPLYVDPIVCIFLDARTRAAADAIRADFPAGENMPRLRTRYYDDRLAEQIAQGCRQVVILGAGLDTRGVRKRAPGVAYFEIDDAGTLDLKKTRYAANRIDAQVTFIPGNYVASGVIPLLEANGFDTGLPSFFIWEGNTMYLTRPDVMKVVEGLTQERFPGVPVVPSMSTGATDSRFLRNLGMPMYGVSGLFVDPAEIQLEPEALSIAPAHAVGDLRHDLVGEARPHLLAGLIHPRVEPHGRTPRRGLPWPGLGACGRGRRPHRRPLAVARFRPPEHRAVRDGGGIWAPARDADFADTLSARVVRPFQPPLHHAHERRLPGSPGRLDPDCDRRLGVWVLDAARDGVRVDAVAEAVIRRPQVAADRLLLVSDDLALGGLRLAVLNGHFATLEGISKR